jgi:hypothetical protein
MEYQIKKIIGDNPYVLNSEYFYFDILDLLKSTFSIIKVKTHDLTYEVWTWSDMPTIDEIKIKLA